MFAEGSALIALASACFARNVTRAAVLAARSSAKMICGHSWKKVRRHRADPSSPNETHKEKGKTSWPTRIADCHRMFLAPGMWTPPALIAIYAGKPHPAFFGATKIMATASCSTNPRPWRNCARQRKRWPAARSRQSAMMPPRPLRQPRQQIPNHPGRRSSFRRFALLIKPALKNRLCLIVDIS